MINDIRSKEILRFPNLIVFVSSFCLMVLEIVAGRIMAPYLGVSLYTWTSIIGVILAGISVGNWVGGKIADLNLSKKILGAVFIFSGIASIFALYTIPVFGAGLSSSGMPLFLSALIFSIIAFFPSSVFLGCICPIVVKINLKNLEKTGRTVGRIYAFSALGSILGTFSAGYFLIAFFGTKTIVFLIAVILLILGIFVAGQEIFKKDSAFLLGLLFLGGLIIPSPCTKETNYYCINLKEVDGSGGKNFVLKLDHLIHSYISPGREQELTYAYEKVYSLVVKYFANKQDASFSTLFLGGGGYTMPRYLEKFYPNAEIEVVEIDPGVTEINYDRILLNRNTKIKTYNEDARMFVEKLKDNKKYDLIFGDAFNDFSVPYHLTTFEFNEKIKNHLAPNGIYAVNIIDNYKYGRFLGSFINTMRKTFPYVYLLPLEFDWQSDHRNTFVVLGMFVPLDEERWHKINTYVSSDGKNLKHLDYLVPTPEIEQFLKEKRVVFLTDNYVPVDNLLAPVFNWSY